jgi:hypothetical protein
MRAIKTGQFADQDLVQCLRLLAVRDPGEFAKFVALTLPKQDYLAARPFAEITEPREAVNPGEYRRPAIPEWGLDLDLRFNSWMPVPIDRALTPQDAYHEICGSPVNPAPGWDWKFDNKGRCFRAIALRPKTPIPEWTQRFDPKLDAMTPVPVDPNVTPGQAYHSEYGSPLLPVPGWEWKFDSRTQRFIPLIMDELRYQERQFATLKLRLYRWHPDEGHYSLIRDDDEDWEEYKDDIYIYEYDAERPVFKRVAVVYEYDPNTDQYVRIAKSIE